jgi:hypothetical protein
MNRLPIPDGPDTLTPEWMTAALRSAGAIGEHRIVGVDAAPISDGVGFLGRVARVALRYDGDATCAPTSLIAKFPATAPTARGIGVAMRFYENEIRVYDHVAPHVPMRMPRRYYGDMRLDSSEFILLIEDMAPARIGDQIAGCRAADAAVIVPQLAAFHARFWETPLLDELDWMPFYNDPCHHHAQASYRQAWPPFQKFVGERLPAPVRDAAERLADQVVRLLDLLSEPPVTVMHGDFRLDNLVFPNGDAAGVGVLDWQITSRGRGAFDLGYFLCTSVSPADRAEHEERLLRSYVDALAEGGVRGYGFDDCMRDYRLTVMFCMVYSVILIGSLDVGNERGLALFNALLERNTAAIMDLKAYELV